MQSTSSGTEGLVVGVTLEQRLHAVVCVCVTVFFKSLSGFI